MIANVLAMGVHWGHVKRFLVVMLPLAVMAFLSWWLLHEQPLHADVRYGELDVDGRVRGYRIVNPNDVVSPAPVVFAFHGIGDCDNSIPMMLIAGADDPVSTIMESNTDRYRNAGCNVEFVRVPRLAHGWSTRHNMHLWRFLSAHPRINAEEAEPADPREPPS